VNPKVSLTSTVHVYVPPSCNTPDGTCHVIGPEPGNDITGDETTWPEIPSVPVVTRNW
jgi:hypothetical protein